MRYIAAKVTDNLRYNDPAMKATNMSYMRRDQFYVLVKRNDGFQYSAGKETTKYFGKKISHKTFLKQDLL